MPNAVIDNSPHAYIYNIDVKKLLLSSHGIWIFQIREKGIITFRFLRFFLKHKVIFAVYRYNRPDFICKCRINFFIRKKFLKIKSTSSFISFRVKNIYHGNQWQDYYLRNQMRCFKTIPEPYLLRINSVPTPCPIEEVWYGADTELIRSRYGRITEIARKWHEGPTETHEPG